jgi:hypothetical protein
LTEKNFNKTVFAEDAKSVVFFNDVEEDDNELDQYECFLQVCHFKDPQIEDPLQYRSKTTILRVFYWRLHLIYIRAISKKMLWKT